MSLPQPSLPSPAYTPDNHPLNHVNQHAILTTEEERKKVRDQVENRLSQLSQDLYELEICAGAVIKGQEDRIPEYMCVVTFTLNYPLVRSVAHTQEKDQSTIHPSP